MTDNEQDTRQQAEELQMQACLTELGGVGPDRSLAGRILQAAAESAPLGQVASAPASMPRWLIAAFVVVGLSVVGGIAYMRSQLQNSQPDKHNATTPVEQQDPQPNQQQPNPQQPEPQQPDPAPIAKPRAITTLIADYSDNRIVEIDANDKIILLLEGIFGAWDVDSLPNGNLLVVEFSVSRVSERDRTGKIIWKFEDLKNPYCAQRLNNGNTLIADTFANRVIEVTEKGEIVWSFDDNVRPFDAEATSTGTILIADVLGDRIIEVNREGQIVWEVRDMPNAHDADRLANGNTLVTLRNKGSVVELDPDGNLVWQLDGLSSPSDADRLPNGNTLVAENTRIREFTPAKQVVWERAMTWAVEVNRGPR